MSTHTMRTMNADRPRIDALFGAPEHDDGPTGAVAWSVLTPHGEAQIEILYPVSSPQKWVVSGPRQAVEWVELRVDGQIQMNHEVVLPRIQSRLERGEVTLPEALRLAYREGLNLGFEAGAQNAADESTT